MGERGRRRPSSGRRRGGGWSAGGRPRLALEKTVRDSKWAWVQRREPAAVETSPMNASENRQGSLVFSRGLSKENILKMENGRKL